MLKREKIYKKIISIIAVCCVLFTTFLQSSIIMADDVVLDNETSSIPQEEVQVINENEVDEEINNNNLNESRLRIRNEILERTVGGKFNVNTDNGGTILYKVLSEDSSSKTGTVSVGEGRQSSGHALVKVPTDKKIKIPEKVQNGEYTYTVTEISSYSFDSKGLDEVILPNTLTKIGLQSLASNNFKKIIIPEGVTRVSDLAFTSCKNLKEIRFPTTIKSLGAAIFGNEAPEGINIYFPTIQEVEFVREGTWTKAPFNGIDGEDLLIVDATQYENMKKNTTLFNRTFQYEAITYEMKLEFFDKDNNPITVNKDVYKLYNKSISWVKGNDGIYVDKWVNLLDPVIIDDMPLIPDENTLGYKANYWGVGEMGLTTINSDGKIETSTAMGGTDGASTGILYTMSSRIFAVEEEIKITESISPKTYDGKSAVKVSFNRNVGNYLKEGGSDYFFQVYIRDKNVDTNTGYELFTDNTVEIDFKNVIDTGEYTFEYGYADNRVTELFFLWYTDKNDVSVQIEAANIYIHPQVNKEFLWDNQTELPEISIKEGDTPGKITWDAGQVPKAGTHKYNYTFIPDNLEGIKYIDIADEPAKSDNYKEKTKKGSIEITYKEVVEHSVTFVDKDNKVIEVRVVEDGKDVIAPLAPEVKGYTFVGWDKPLTNITADTTIKALYESNSSGDLVVDIEKDTPIDVPATKEEIKDAVLTEKEKQEYLSGTDVNIKVIVKRIPEVVDKIVKNALNGRKDGAYFDIAIYKKIGNQPEVKVNAIKKTMRFVIDIPEELYAKKGVNRVFEVMRIHDGKVDILKDLDTDDKTVTIETDRFSTYVLCYTDSDLSETKPNGPETSDSTNVTGLMSLFGVSLVIIIVASKKQKNNSKSRI